MDPTQNPMLGMLQAIAQAATSSGQNPQGSEYFTNPYGFNPMTNRSMAPLMQSSQTMQMIGMFAPMALQMFAPELAAQLGTSGNIFPGLSSQARNQQLMAMTFRKAQSQQSMELAKQAGRALNWKEGTINQAASVVDTVGMFMPEVGNILGRFDTSGVGFGYDAAMMSLVTAGGRQTQRVDQHSAEFMAKNYARYFQRDGKGDLAGSKVLDFQKTGGLMISEVAQLQADLANRGLTGDAYAGINNVDKLFTKLSDEDRVKAGDAKTMTELRKRVSLASIADAKEQVIGENVGEFAKRDGTMEKYAKGIHTASSVFTSLQGNTQELLKAMETLEGPLSKFDPARFEETVAKYVQMLNKSGLSADEMLKGMQVFSARTGITDAAMSMAAIGKAGSARWAAAGAGVSQENIGAITAGATDALGGAMKNNAAMLTLHLQNKTGQDRTLESMKIMSAAPGEYTPDQVLRARRWLANPMAGNKGEAAGFDAENRGAAQNEILQNAEGKIGAGYREYLNRQAGEKFGTGSTAAERRGNFGELAVSAATGVLGSEFNRTLNVYAQTRGGKAAMQRVADAMGLDVTKDAAQIQQILGDAAAVSRVSGDEARIIAMGSAGKGDAASVNERLEKLYALAGEGTAALGGIGEDALQRLTAGRLMSAKSRETSTPEYAELLEQVRAGGNVAPATPGQALGVLLEMTGETDEKGNPRKRGASDYIRAIMQGFGVLGNKSELTEGQRKMIDEGAWGKEYESIMRLPDSEDKKNKLQKFMSTARQALDVGTDNTVLEGLGAEEINARLNAEKEKADEAQRKADGAKEGTGDGKNVNVSGSARLDLNVSVSSDGTARVDGDKTVDIPLTGNSASHSSEGSAPAAPQPPSRNTSRSDF